MSRHLQTRAIDTLERRATFLKGRIASIESANNPRADAGLDRDKAELQALDHALDILCAEQGKACHRAIVFALRVAAFNLDEPIPQREVNKLIHHARDIEAIARPNGVVEG